MESSLLTDMVYVSYNMVVFLSLAIISALDSVDTDKIPRYAAFRLGHHCQMTHILVILSSVSYFNTPHTYSQWLNSVIYWLINHCTDWARTCVTSFGR